MEQEELLEKFMNDIQAAIDLYGDAAVEHALEDAYTQLQPMKMMETKSASLNENALGAAQKFFRGLLGAGKGPARPGVVGRAIGRELDQDVWISGQDDPLEVKSDLMGDLIKQTNDLVEKTNELLSQLGTAMELSNKGLGALDLNMDDLISRVSGKSIADVRSSQGTLRVGEPPDIAPSMDEPLPPEEEGLPTKDRAAAV